MFLRYFNNFHISTKLFSQKLSYPVGRYGGPGHPEVQDAWCTRLCPMLRAGRLEEDDRAQLSSCHFSYGKSGTFLTNYVKNEVRTQKNEVKLRCLEETTILMVRVPGTETFLTIFF